MIVADERVAKFVSDKLDFAICPPFTCLGIERDSQIVAGVIFHCFEGRNVHVTAAGTGWTKGLFKAVGNYAFGQLGCARMTFTTADPKVAEYVCRLGGKIEGCMRDQFGDGVDGILIGILPYEWRYVTVA